MSYSVEYTKQSEKFLDKLPKEDRITIMRKIDAIKQNPIQHLKKLHGPFWRLRILKYRAIIDVIIKGKRMIVLKIGHRKSVYNN